MATPSALPTRAPTLTAVQRLTIVATGLGMFMVFLDALVVNVALPDIQDEFGVGESGAQAVVTAYSVGMAVTIMWSATLADLRGRRRVYLGAAVVFCLASITCGVSANFSVLVVGRAVQGLAAGPITVASLALVSAAFSDKKERTRAIGFWTGIGAVGTALGPTVGGILTEELGWRSVFLVNVPVGVLLVILTLTGVRESRDPAERTFDYAGQALFGVAVAAFAAGLIIAPRNGWLSFSVILLFATTVIGLAVFARHELGADDPMMDLRLFVNHSYRLALIGLFVIFFVAYGALLIITQFFQNVRGYSAIDAGLLILPFAIGFAVMSPLVGKLIARIGQRPTVLLGLSLATIGMMSSAIGLGVSPWLASLSMLPVSVGSAMTLVALTGLSMASVAPDKSGMASGLMSTQRAIGSTTGYALFGSILALWLDARLGDALTSIVPDDAQRDAVTSSIVDQANPTAFIAEVGPRNPISVATASNKAQIIAAADDVFVRGMQAAIGVGVVVLVLTLVAVWRGFPRDEPDADE
jgi:EmrB/QacA subfamily drug resistance transporter